jgi:tRNA pseudouridine55 synthase
MVSAIKIEGQRLHNLARQGIEVERPPRIVTVERLDLFEVDGEPSVFRIEVDCSTGTYIRSLAADLGTALGGGAHLRNLRRTSIGSFGVDEAHTLEGLATEHVLTPAQGLRDLHRIEVSPDAARRVSHGLPVERGAIGAEGDGPFALVDISGRLIAVYEAGPGERIVAAVVLAS